MRRLEWLLALSLADGFGITDSYPWLGGASAAHRSTCRHPAVHGTEAEAHGDAALAAPTPHLYSPQLLVCSSLLCRVLAGY